MIYIVSLQYSPVFKSLCYALGNQLQNEGKVIKYILSSHYDWMIPKKQNVEFIGNSKDIKTIFRDSVNYNNFKKIKELFLENKPETVYFFNIHPFYNYYIARIVKQYGGKVIQHVHEPYVGDKIHYGKFQRCWLYLFEYIQALILKKSDVAILSSKEAWNLFNKRYPDFEGKKIMIPLLYEDNGKNVSIKSNHRTYLNFIGPPVLAKGPEKFLNIVEQCQVTDLNFLLISRMKITDKKYYQYDNLEIFYHEKISDDLIAKFMKKSIMTITPYKTARQSSVASTAFMCGTPVLATNINGLNEVVDHKITGYLVDKDASVDEWLDGVIYIKNNIEDLSNNCRDFFKTHYSEINWPKYFKEVFEIEA